MALQPVEFWAALREWRPLLEVLLDLNALSPVGAAIHWIRSRGYSALVPSSHRTCPTSRLWRLVPHLLASRVAVYIAKTQTREQKLQRREEEQEEDKENDREGDESLPAKKRNKSSLGNCMWMQTLPSIAQVNILGFLAAEHRMFHVKDLELLALDLLSNEQLDFCVGHAAEHLLSKVGLSNKHTEGKDFMKHYSVPSWLLGYNAQPPLLPWMPATPLEGTGAVQDETRRFLDKGKSNLDNVKNQQLAEASTSGPSLDEGKGSVEEERRQDREDEIMGLGTPPHISEGRKRTIKEQLPAGGGSLAFSESKGIALGINIDMTSEQKAGECNQFFSEGEHGSAYALATSLTEAWLERQPTIEDMQSFSILPDPIPFLKILKPWEMQDDTVLNMVKVFLSKDSGFALSAQILTYCLLPKMLHLEQPASRFLVLAVMEAAKAHPRAVVDALLVPSVLCERGPNKAQCDVINRAVKEGLPDNHISAFCQKIFLKSRRQPLTFGKPPVVPVDDDLLSKSVVWSEPAWAIVQSILSRPVKLADELIEALVSCCVEEAGRFAKSLKFSSFLLCLISGHGAHLKPYKSMLLKVAEQTDTFMTKSLAAKSSAL